MQDALDETDTERGEAAVYIGDVIGILLADFFDYKTEVLS